MFSCPEVFCKKGVLKNFRKLIRKHLCQSLFNKVAGRPATLLKKRETLAQVLSCEFCEILKRTPISIEHLWWLLLKELVHINA